MKEKAPSKSIISNLWREIQGFTDYNFVQQPFERPFPYLFSIVVIALATIIDLHYGLFSSTPELLFLVAVVGVAWYGGLGPSLFAVVLSVLAQDYFFFDPKYELNLNSNDLPSLLSFSIAALAMSSLVASQKRAESLISRIALHDQLTGLPNRRLFDDRLENAMSISDRNREKLAIVFLDLDVFKEINDTWGHKIGDEVLKAVAKLLDDATRDEDTVSRWGGDEFVMLFQQINSVEDIHVIIDKIYYEFSKPLVVDQNKIRLSASAGISIYPDHGLSRAALVKAADDALYESKHSGRNQYKIYGEKARMVTPLF